MAESGGEPESVATTAKSTTLCRTEGNRILLRLANIVPVLSSIVNPCTGVSNEYRISEFTPESRSVALTVSTAYAASAFSVKRYQYYFVAKMYCKSRQSNS